MQLQACISASPFDEHYQMAYVYCRDVTTGYCFSLSRFTEEDEIELMVVDQLKTKVADICVRFNGNRIYAELGT